MAREFSCESALKIDATFIIFIMLIMSKNPRSKIGRQSECPPPLGPRQEKIMIDLSSGSASSAAACDHVRQDRKKQTADLKKTS